MWCAEQAGYNMRNKGFNGNCGSFLSKANVSGTSSLQPGDILVYVFNKIYTAQHVGIFVSYNSDGTLSTVEGNRNSHG